MKKKFISVVLILIMVCSTAFCLSSCHGKKANAAFEVPDSFDTSKTYEITFWAKNDTNKSQVDIYNKAVEDFEKIYPNIKINIRFYTDYSRIYNDVITNISTGTTPNICITYQDHIATYISGANTVVPLDDLISDEKFGLGGSEVKFDAPTADEMVQKFLDEEKINGVTYGVPYMRSTEALYINKTYVEKLGYTIPDVVTWDWIWEVSDAAMALKSDGKTFKVNDQTIMIPFIYKSTDNMLIQMLHQLGAGYTTESGEILLFNDTTKEILTTIKEHAEKKSFSTFKIASYPANFFNAGQCIFAIDSTAGSTWMGSEAPLLDIPKDQLVDFETVVRAIPQYDTNDISMISQGPSICIFNKSDKGEVLASWLFVQYLLSNDVQIAYSETEGYVPVTTKAQKTKEYKDYLDARGTDNNAHYSIKIDATKLLLTNTENTFITPVFNGSASVRDVAGQLIENTVKAVNRNQTVDDAFFEKQFTDVAAQYHLNQSSGNTNTIEDLGPLPSTAVWLLSVLGGVWVIIIACFVVGKIKNKANKS